MGDILKEDILEVESLSCGYEGRAVVEDFSFSFKRGAFLGVIGPNGAGKTTLFKAISKILKPMSGCIRYDGADLSRISAMRLARDVAVLPQLLEIPFSFSVEEFVMMGRYPHLGRFHAAKREDMDKVADAMKSAEVSHLARRMIKNLSGGERQRVLFAQALAQEPRLMLLDEPVSHLDIRHQVELLDLLKRLNKRGLTVIVTLHDLNLASEYCDELILMDEGRISAKGAPEEILTYQTIEKVYKTPVIVKENPVSKKPYVFLVSEHDLKSKILK